VTQPRTNKANRHPYLPTAPKRKKSLINFINHKFLNLKTLYLKKKITQKEQQA
jgi:hypothetical protein